MLTPHAVLSRPGDPEVQLAASEPASRPEEGGPAAQHPGGRRSDRLHLRSPGALGSSSSSAGCLRQRVPAHDRTRKPRLLAPLPVFAAHPSLPVRALPRPPSPSSASSPSATPSPTAPSLRRAAAAAGGVKGDGQPGAAPRRGVGTFLSALGAVLPSILRQQSAADGEDEAEEDGLAGLVAVEER